MTYILGPGNRVLFRSDWTGPDITRTAVEYLLARRDGLRLASFYAQIEGSRWVDNAAFTAGLQRNVQQAVEEFAAAQARWARGDHLGNVAPVKGWPNAANSGENR